MPFRRLAVLVALLPFTITTTASAVDLSFPAATERLTAANDSLRAAAAEVKQRSSELEAARRLGLPKVDAVAAVTRIDAPIVIDLAPIRSAMLALHPQVPSAAIPPFRLTVQDSLFARATLKLSQPLYTGGRITAAQQGARAQLNEATELSRAAYANATTELVRRYFGLALATRVVAVRRDVVAALTGHQRHARRLEEEGLIARAERMNADVALAEAQRALLKSEGDAQLAQKALAAVLAEDSADLAPSTPLFLVDELPSELLKNDLTANAALLRAHALQQQAAAATRAEEAGARPQVGLFGARELYEGDLTLLDPSWNAGVGVSLSLFDAGRASRVAASRAREERAEILEQKARRDLATLFDSHVTSLTNARAQFRTASSARALAEENLRLRSRAFDEGFATSLDVVDARLALARVDLDRLAAAYDFDVALASLLEVRGESVRYDALRRTGVEVH